MSEYKIIDYARNALVLFGVAVVLLEPVKILHDYTEIADLNGDGKKEVAIKIDNLRIGWANHDKGILNLIPKIFKDSTKSLDKKLK